MGRILALDVGDKRIGLALSDPFKMIANPFDTLFRKDIDFDLNFLVELLKQKEVELIVCGLPRSMNAAENEQTTKTRAFTELLKQKTTVPIKFIDERLTTVSAQKVLIEGGVRRENRKQVIDKVAATIILQNFLDYYQK